MTSVSYEQCGMLDSPEEEVWSYNGNYSHNLHWLPVTYEILFKLCLVVFKTLLRSTCQNMLFRIPSTNISTYDRLRQLKQCYKVKTCSVRQPQLPCLRAYSLEQAFCSVWQPQLRCLWAHSLEQAFCSIHQLQLPCLWPYSLEQAFCSIHQLQLPCLWPYSLEQAFCSTLKTELCVRRAYNSSQSALSCSTRTQKRAHYKSLDTHTYVCEYFKLNDVCNQWQFHCFCPGADIYFKLNDATPDVCNQFHWFCPGADIYFEQN